jgi:hypothetical protein
MDEYVKRDPTAGTITVSLRWPVQNGKSELAELVLRDAVTVEDLEEMDAGKGEVRKTVILVEALTGVSRHTLLKLRSVDYLEVAGVVGELLGKEPSGTGET